MEFKLYSHVADFYTDAYEILLEGEAQNLVILGNLITGFEGTDKFGWRDPANWLMAAVWDGPAVRLTALMTPPYNITMYAAGNKWDSDMLNCLVNGLVAAKAPIKGVMTEKALAQDFASAYCAVTKQNQNIFMSQRIYELKQVNPEIPKSGNFRPAKECDIFYLPYWIEDFHSSATGNLISPHADLEKYRYHIQSGSMFVLEQCGTPVSIARIARRLVTVAGIGFIYTPPFYRGRGFASSITAQTSQIALDSGLNSCVLYTDLSNPTSNSIYQKIGYKPICDSLEITFVP